MKIISYLVPNFQMVRNRKSNGHTPGSPSTTDEDKDHELVPCPNAAAQTSRQAANAAANNCNASPDEVRPIKLPLFSLLCII